jgi:hypothetical protein
MKVVVPAINDFSTVGTYIAHECHNMSTYLLQPVNEISKQYILFNYNNNNFLNIVSINYITLY